MTRLISLVILGLHFYYFSYEAFLSWQLTSTFTDRMLVHIAATGLFKHFGTGKWLALGLLIISLLGTPGKKTETLKRSSLVACLVVGVAIYFGSQVSFTLASQR